VETVVRKLLVASQKGGIGKTTTSINLAAATAMAGARVLLLDVDPLSGISASLNLSEHPRRQSMRVAGVDLPGVLVTGVLPGLDILNPYEDSGCSDQDLDDLLKVLASPEIREAYDCLVINTPPFLGANASQLLGAAEEYLLVMRAEPLAYRTLPAFQELIHRSQRDHPVAMKGILLTLAEGETPGSRWDRELRGRFGTRILPQVVPFDEEVGKAVLFGQIAVSAAPEAPAAQTYHGLAAELNLAAGAKPEQQQAESPLLAVATSMRLAGAFKRRTTQKVQKLVSVLSDHGEDASFLPAEETARFDAGSDHPNSPGLDEVVFQPLPELDADDEAPAPAPPNSSIRRSAAPPTAPSSALPKARVTPPNPPPAPQPAAFPAPALNLRGLTVAVGLAIVFGIALRFVTLPEALVPYVVPIGVGIAVTAGIVLVLRLILIAEASDAKSARLIAKGAVGGPTLIPSSATPFTKLPSRESKKDTNTRLANLARQRRKNQQ
jgi:chromosome partitioning protein